jgi:hypothetical protein
MIDLSHSDISNGGGHRFASADPEILTGTLSTSPPKSSQGKGIQQ